MRHYHKVFISKAYYPQEIWPQPRWMEAQFTARVLAKNRTEAAKKAWDKFGPEWRKLMRRQDFKISLHVSSPTAGVGGFAGRLSPIRIN